MTATQLDSYQAMPWSAFYKQLRQGPTDAGRWVQGDHFLVCGPTNSGKTTLARQITGLRSHVVVFVTKQHDDTFKREYKGWTILREWPREGPKSWQTHILLWPKAVKNNLRASVEVARAVFYTALNRIASIGNWCVVIDESLMFASPRFIGLGKEVEQLHYHGRSSGVTMLDLTQRPAWIPPVIYSSVTHALIARTRDKNDLKRLADMGNIDAKAVTNALLRLQDRHDYLYLNPQGDASPVIVNTRK